MIDILKILGCCSEITSAISISITIDNDANPEYLSDFSSHNNSII